MSERYIACTLVDITNTGVTSRSQNHTAHHQEQNFNTLIQLLSLRTQPFECSVSKLEAQDMSAYEFGSNYTGTIQDVWELEFSVETVDIWREGNNPMYHAGIDCDQVPVYTGLLETALIAPFFSAQCPLTKNIHFKSAGKHK